MTFVTKGRGIVKVIIRMARFKLTMKPMLKKVALSADATPLLLAGTEPIMELMFGEPNNPVPTPKRPRYATTAKEDVDASTVDRSNRETLVTASPDDVKGK